MDNDENQIGGYSISEIREYLEKNQEEYLNRFRQIDRKKKFNGAAAFFGPLWFAYRMMWIEGFLLWLISSVITLFASFIIYILILANIIYTKESAGLLLFLLWIVEFLIIGKMADSIYWWKIKKRIDATHWEDGKKRSIIQKLANAVECKGASLWSAIVFSFLLRFGDVVVGAIGIAMATVMAQI
ncbi:hypothetical protein LAD12857_11660 [Lacrimispora amygdalina]|uniref:DUF2628 domain-containing protein n=1 Tax=Lacrimispora amygdalina TaxID=253257 RepID=A0A3E2NCE8_9FIRM|nr:DUF2628 domain-containing protein [Clostridium indicum]RFZ78697.1 DUF2628 domain-containing protein [Clostridium indicum]